MDDFHHGPFGPVHVVLELREPFPQPGDFTARVLPFLLDMALVVVLDDAVCEHRRLLGACRRKRDANDTRAALLIDPDASFELFQVRRSCVPAAEKRAAPDFQTLLELAQAPRFSFSCDRSGGLARENQVPRTIAHRPGGSRPVFASPRHRRSELRVLRQDLDNALKVIARTDQRHMGVDALLSRRSHGCTLARGTSPLRLNNQLGYCSVLRRDQQSYEGAQDRAQRHDGEDQPDPPMQDARELTKLKVAPGRRLARALHSPDIALLFPVRLAMRHICLPCLTHRLCPAHRSAPSSDRSRSPGFGGCHHAENDREPDHRMANDQMENTE